MDKDAIAEKLNLIMRQRGLNATELSNITGISRSTLEGYLKAKSLIKIDSLLLICEKLTISSDFILGLPEIANSKYQLSSEDEKILSYYNRLDEENRDYIKGEMVRLYKEESAENEKASTIAQ